MASIPGGFGVDVDFDFRSTPTTVGSSFPDEEGAASPASRKKFERNLDKVDEAMTEAKQFLNSVNKNMGGFDITYNRLANFMFLAVIFGIEFDMFGFVFGAVQYWEYDNPLLRALMFFSVAGYAAPLIMLQCDAGGMSVGGETSQPHRTPIGTGASTKGKQRGNEYLRWMMRQNRPANPFGGSMEYYHYMPILRYYLLVKSSLDLADVDAIFKVNTLSSFSLGIFQIMGIIATMASGYPFTIYVWINVASQVINWPLTILYFASPIAAWMGRAGKAKTLSRFYDGLADHWSRTYTSIAALIFLHDDGDEERNRLEMEKKQVKVRIAHAVCSAFAGRDGVSIEKFGLHRMRDGDVKDFLQIMRDQAMAQLSVNNAQ
eukprot:TRINITY_DN11843_c0_g1_i4.p1 TRINITY_DN11843_c0_g1~~TRINITY_DN11843_c0_g1_i4.p1  ORF type:complete len:375 (-),score=58.80 TRINITY_DN11843_c0_g1_i4:281-1405(-)